MFYDVNTGRSLRPNCALRPYWAAAACGPCLPRSTRQARITLIAFGAGGSRAGGARYSLRSGTRCPRRTGRPLWPNDRPVLSVLVRCAGPIRANDARITITALDTPVNKIDVAAMGIYWCGVSH